MRKSTLDHLLESAVAEALGVTPPPYRRKAAPAAGRKVIHLPGRAAARSQQSARA
jgi:hypothetical protein